MRKQLGSAPTNAEDAATKGYVDRGLENNWKADVRVVSTANINLASPGTTIDGTTMTTGDRFLAKDQTTAAQNGIYVFNGSAVPATRALDANTSVSLVGARVFATEGGVGHLTYWHMDTTGAITLDTTGLTWSKFAYPSVVNDKLVQRDGGGFIYVNDPTASDHAVSKNYVDTVQNLGSWKNSARAASTTNVTISGPGTTIDGVTLTTNDRVLLKDQSTASQNGIYVFNGAAVAMTRALDADSSTELLGARIAVREGTANGGSTWRMSTTSITLGTTSLVWVDASGADKNYVDGLAANFVPIGTIVPTARFTAPSTWLIPDGRAVSRTTYPDLFTAINPIIGVFTVTIASPGVFTLNSHGMATGQQVYLTTTGALPTGLAANTNYWVINTGTNTFNLATSLVNAMAGTAINTTGSQSGAHTLRTTHGVGDGSTTFNLPNPNFIPPTVASGLISITPSAANTPTSGTVTFPAGLFTDIPQVVATPDTSVPGTTTGVLGVGTLNVTATGCNIILTRGNTTGTGIRWLAVQTTKPTNIKYLIKATTSATTGTGNPNVGKANTTIYNTAGTYTYVPPANLLYVKVRVQAGGGGGGGRSAGTNTWSVGGGGGGGGYAEAIIKIGDLNPAGETVVVGALGAGGVNTTGSNGGDSSFGTLVTASGGAGGVSANGANTAGLNGNGGSGGGFGGAATTLVGVVGADGSQGRIPYNATLTTSSSNFGQAGHGGKSVMGNGGWAPGIGQSGSANNGTGYGGGGSGMFGANATGSGANGTAGIVIIEEYSMVIGDIDTGGIDFFVGTTAPDAALGNNGDVYLRY